MKSNKGITLTSLVIYIIGLVLIITLISVFTGYFYKNLEEITVKQNADEQYSSFLSYITKDANSDYLTYVKSASDENDYIIFKFKDGIEHQYIYQNETIYYINVENGNDKKIVLCENVGIYAGKIFNYSDGKIDININIDDNNFSTTLNVKI